MVQYSLLLSYPKLYKTLTNNILETGVRLFCQYLRFLLLLLPDREQEYSKNGLWQRFRRGCRISPLRSDLVTILRIHLAFLWLSAAALNRLIFIETPDLQMAYTAFDFFAFITVLFTENLLK
jgi:hypothetical protein